MLGLTIEARMGRKRVVVATLLVHSVKVAMRRHSRKAMAGWGMLCRGVSLVPNHADRPDFCKRADRDARLEREEPHQCSVAVLMPIQPSLLRAVLMQSAGKHSRCSRTGLFSKLNKKEFNIISHLRNWKVGDPAFTLHYWQQIIISLFRSLLGHDQYLNQIFIKAKVFKLIS